MLVARWARKVSGLVAAKAKSGEQNDGHKSNGVKQ